MTAHDSTARLTRESRHLIHASDDVIRARLVEPLQKAGCERHKELLQLLERQVDNLVAEGRCDFNAF